MARYAVDHAFFASRDIPYVPVHRRKQLAFSNVVYNGIAIRRAEDADLQQMAIWLKDERIYRPLGFSRSIPLKYLRRSVVPDLTGTTEAVEFLSVRDAGPDTAIGFVICYEARKAGDANQEVDFALADPANGGRVGVLRTVKVGLLTYLFAVCGAETVHWIRRKPPPASSVEDGTAGKYLRHGAPIVVGRDDFAAMLRRLETDGARKALPVVVFRTGRHRVPTT